MAEGVRKRGDVWYAYWSEPHPDTGRPRRVEKRAVDEGQPNSEQGAIRARRAALKRLDDGLRPSGKTVTQVVERYIRLNPKLKPHSRFTYGRIARLYITPHLGARLAHELAPGDVRDWHATLAAAQLAPRTIQGAHAVLSGALRMEMVDFRSLPRNVAVLVAPPAPPPPEDPPAWDEAEIVRFVGLAASDERDGALWMLLILTGLRIGEALELTWDHVELEKAALHVRQTATRDELGKRSVGPPKRPSSRRDMTMPPELVSALRAHRDRTTFTRRPTPHQPGPVFPIGYAAVLHRLTAFCRQHGFGDDITPHSLRHIHLSWLASGGLDPLAIIARSGHSKLSALDPYLHPSPGSDAALTAAITARLKTNRNAAQDAESGTERGSAEQ